MSQHFSGETNLSLQQINNVAVLLQTASACSVAMSRTVPEEFEM